MDVCLFEADVCSLSVSFSPGGCDDDDWVPVSSEFIHTDWLMVAGGWGAGHEETVTQRGGLWAQGHVAGEWRHRAIPSDLGSRSHPAPCSSSHNRLCATVTTLIAHGCTEEQMKGWTKGALLKERCSLLIWSDSQELYTFEWHVTVPLCIRRTSAHELRAVPSGKSWQSKCLCAELMNKLLLTALQGEAFHRWLRTYIYCSLPYYFRILLLKNS